MPIDNRSQKEKLLDLPEADRLEFLNSLEEKEAEALLYDWHFNGRPKQLEGIVDPDWFIWLILAGRGFGKTRTGAEMVRHWIENCGKRRIGIISPTTADLRDVIVEGESGIINVFPPWNRPSYEPTKRRITWPNGAIATLYSGEEPERLRGPQHDALWCLSGDTLVATQLGQVRIDEIDPTKHIAWTPWGYKKIYQRVLTNPAAETYTARFANGTINATFDHLVYSNGTFKPLGEAKCVTFVRNTKERCITSEHLDATNWAESDWLAWSTKMRLVRSLPGMISITRTMTARTIQLRIWLHYLRKNTTQYMRTTTEIVLKNDTRTHQRSRSFALNAENRTTKNNGQANLQNFAQCSALTTGENPRRSGQSNVFAKFVRHLTQLKDHIKSIVPSNAIAKQPNLEDQALTKSPLKSLEKSPNLIPVYDIGVEGGVFIANGFIVHNCDELAGFSSPEIMQRAWDMAMFGLRLGDKPQVVMTTTPKPVPIIQEFIKKYRAQREGKRLDEGLILLTTGSSYENKTNLARTFFNQLVQYEGTVLGRQEIHAEVINMEEMGIIKRSWFKLWPANKPLPFFDFIIQSYDTAFTEKTHNDPTACQVWGVFRPDKDSPYCVMLIDSWTDHLQYPDLRKRVETDFKTVRYGGNPNDPYDRGQPPDIVLVEEKGSGITLIQDLNRSGVPVRAYNPGKMDKVQRLHAVSHLVANGRCYIPESTKVPGEFRTWATDFITEICVFPNSLHDDQVDAFTQALALLRDQTWLTIDKEEVEERYADDAVQRTNPYAC